MHDRDGWPSAPGLGERARALSREDRGAGGWADRVDALLVELRSAGTAADVPACATWLDDPDRALAERATGAIAGVLGRSGPLDLTWIDLTIRPPWWHGVGASHAGWSTPPAVPPGSRNRDEPAGRAHYWTNSRPLGPWASSDRTGRAAANLPPRDRERPDVAGTNSLGLESLHYDGQVRAVAVGKLAAMTSGAELPYLLIRANDWVEPVRLAAATALAARVCASYAEHFVSCLPLVGRLATCERADHGPFVAAVHALLLAPAARDALLGGLRSTEPLVARGCCRLALAAPGPDLVATLAAESRHRDPAIRLAGSRAGRARLAPADFLALVPTWLADRSAPVRREALLGLVERASGRAEAALRGTLLDPHRSAREVARFYLPRLGPFDAAAFYRATLGSPPGAALPWALAGLGETGTPADVDLVRPFLSDPAGRVRREAVRAVGRLAGPAHVPALLAALADPHPGVCRAAAAALSPVARLVPPAALVGFAAGDHPRHVRRRALGLIPQVGKWPALPHLIRATRDPDPALASKATILLASWQANFNRSPVRPSPGEIADARAALDAAPLPAATDRAIRFLLRGWADL